MEKVLIVSKEYKTIINYLENQIENIEFEGYLDIYSLYERLSKAPLRAKSVVVTDTAFFNNRLGIADPTEAGRQLIGLLGNSLFAVDYITFLNVVPKNSQINSIIGYIKETYQGTASLTLETKETPFLVEDIKIIITEKDKDYIQVEPDTSFILRKQRGSNIRDIPIEGKPTDRVLVTDYYTKMQNKQEIKDSLKSAIGYEILGDNIENNDDFFEIEDLSIPPILKELNEKNQKYIVVTGESKSGCSTSAMILASSASSLGKTLVVDLNYTNLGLSFLAEKTLVPTEVKIIPISDIIEEGKQNNKNGVDILKTKTLDQNQLHVLSLKLALKDILTIEDLSFFVENIVHVVQDYYRFIVFDIPLYNIDNFKNIVNLADKLVVCSPPFKNNIISTLYSLENSKVRMLDIFNNLGKNDKNENIILMRTNIFKTVHPNIKPMKIKDITNYTTNINKFTMKITGIFEYKNTYNEEELFTELLISEKEGAE